MASTSLVQSSNQFKCFEPYSVTHVATHEIHTPALVDLLFSDHSCLTLLGNRSFSLCFLFNFKSINFQKTFFVVPFIIRLSDIGKELTSKLTPKEGHLYYEYELFLAVL